MSWIIGLLTGLPGLLSKGLDYYIKRADGDVIKATELMKADQVRMAAQRDITIAGMSHPMWWLGYLLFVIPTGVYYAKIILWDKVLALGSTDPLNGFVLEWAGTIVISIFGMQVGVGLVGSLLNRIGWR